MLYSAGIDAAVLLDSRRAFYGGIIAIDIPGYTDSVSPGIAFSLTFCRLAHNMAALTASHTARDS